MSAQNQNHASIRTAILIPVFNDWASIEQLLPAISSALVRAGLGAAAVVVDDGSAQPAPETLYAAGREGLTEVRVLRLVCNTGHQRAIAVGLSYLAEQDFDVVVVMDGDGEDRADDVPRLVMRLMESREDDIVFAGRLQRSESTLFRLGYHSYRLLHWLLTGIPIRFGNFSAARMAAVRQLVYMGSIWNHYAAAIQRSRLRYSLLPTARGKRFAGQSKLDLSQLVAHGLSALSVFSETICARLLLLAMLSFSVCLVAMLLAVFGGGLYFALFLATASLGVVLGCLVLLSVIALVALRSFPSFIPIRDARGFIGAIQSCSEKSDTK